MNSYLQLLRRIYVGGTAKHPTRAESGETKNPTRGLANLHFHHDLSEGFPLLTTRAMNFTGMVGELRTFLEGAPHNEQFEKNGCKFWRPWADVIYKRTEGKFPRGYLGNIYGVQWNAHGQLDHVLHCLRHRPTDRRMVVSAWRPDENDFMALPPCHLLWVVTPYDGRLNLSWIQRSCDFPLGVPYNIASYALLTHVLARWAGMEPGCIDSIFCDAHIYENQMDGVRQQLSRIPTGLPTVEVDFTDNHDFHSWQVRLNGYNHDPAINFGAVEV